MHIKLRPAIYLIIGLLTGAATIAVFSFREINDAEETVEVSTYVFAGITF